MARRIRVVWVPMVSNVCISYMDIIVCFVEGFQCVIAYLYPNLMKLQSDVVASQQIILQPFSGFR